MKWEDGTSYSKFDHERIPRIWELPITKKMTLVVHRHVYDESTWFMTLHDHNSVVIDMINLYTDNAETAKANAVHFVLGYLYEQKDLIQSAIDDMKREFYVKYI